MRFELIYTIKVKYINYLIMGVLSSLVSCEKEPMEDIGESVNLGDYVQNRTNISSTPPMPDENILKNGNLEKWFLFTSYDILDGWYCHNNRNVKQERKNVFEGRYSARMSSMQKGKTATIDQGIQVTPNHQIRIYFHYYVERWQEKGARMYCYFRTGSAKNTALSASELKKLYDTKTFYIIRGGGYGLSYFPHEEGKWLIFDETITVPSDANYFTFGVNSYYGTTIYIDDCYVVDITNNE